MWCLQGVYNSSVGLNGGTSLLAGCAVVVVLLVAPADAANTIRGTVGPDKIKGTKRGDVITSFKGNDKIDGRAGGDFIKASAGDDRINGGGGFDEIKAGSGDDVVDLRDGKRDLVNCGKGIDKVKVDEVEDGVFDCEKVKEPNEQAPE